ncbi:MAG TPA: hypothetical protein VLD38_08790 [Nitrosopumilaceae archaeon]|nr:hypothetical protein [Nitrosopumilaceae archaeon]
MISKTILVLSLTAVFAVSMITSVAASYSWLNVDLGNVTVKGQKTIQLTIDASDAIPRNAGVGVLAGYGWFYADGPDTVFAVSTHNPVRDSHQNPDHWHVHNVVAGSTLSQNPAVDACIVSLSDYVEAGISIQGDIMTINVPAVALTGELGAGPGAFEIVPTDSSTCGETVLANGNPSGLHLGVKFQ